MRVRNVRCCGGGGAFREVLIVLKDLKERMELARFMGGTQANKGEGSQLTAWHVSVTPGGCGTLGRKGEKMRWFGQNSAVQVWQRGNGGRNGSRLMCGSRNC